MCVDTEFLTEYNYCIVKNQGGNAMKKVLCLMLTLCMLISIFALGGISVSAKESQDEILVRINGTKQQYDVMPIIQDGRTLVPMRGFLKRSALRLIGMMPQKPLQVQRAIQRLPYRLATPRPM